MRMSQVVHPDNLDTNRRAYPGDSLAEPNTGPGKDSLFWIQLIELVGVCFDFLQEKSRNINQRLLCSVLGG